MIVSSRLHVVVPLIQVGKRSVHWRSSDATQTYRTYSLKNRRPNAAAAPPPTVSPSTGTGFTRKRQQQLLLCVTEYSSEDFKKGLTLEAKWYMWLHQFKLWNTPLWMSNTTVVYPFALKVLMQKWLGVWQPKLPGILVEDCAVLIGIRLQAMIWSIIVLFKTRQLIVAIPVLVSTLNATWITYRFCTNHKRNQRYPRASIERTNLLPT